MMENRNRAELDAKLVIIIIYTDPRPILCPGEWGGGVSKEPRRLGPPPFLACSVSIPGFRFSVTFREQKFPE